jgi:hypothetical protein
VGVQQAPVHGFQSANERGAEVYRQERQPTAMRAAAAMLAIGVAMPGAYALVTAPLQRRRAELGLRRRHGASDATIGHLGGSERTVRLLVAAAIALPRSSWLWQRYFARFHERVGNGSGVASPPAAASRASPLATAATTFGHGRPALAIRLVEALQRIRRRVRSAPS